MVRINSKTTSGRQNSGLNEELDISNFEHKEVDLPADCDPYCIFVYSANSTKSDNMNDVVGT